MKNKLVALAVAVAGFGVAAVMPSAAAASSAHSCSAYSEYNSTCCSTYTQYCSKSVPLKLKEVAKQSGNTLVLKFTVSNPNSVFAGYTDPAKNVTPTTLCVTIPKGLGYASSSPKATLKKGKVCFKVGRIGPKGSKSFQLKLRVLAGTNRKVAIKAAVSGTSITPLSKSITVKVKHHGKTSATKVTG